MIINENNSPFLNDPCDVEMKVGVGGGMHVV